VAFVHVDARVSGLDGRALLRDARADAVHIEVHVDAIGDGLGVAILHDHILIEEANGLAAGRGGEANEERVEVKQYLAPKLIDGAVALIDYDEVEEFRRDGGVVDHIGRLALPWLRRIEAGAFLVASIELHFALEHGVEALDGGDDHLRGRVDRVRLEPLNGVELRKLSWVVWRLEVGELILSLLAEVGAVHQKENALGVAELEQTIGDVDGGEGFAGAGRHLNQCARIGFGEGLFQASDGAGLDAPKMRRVEFGECL
jgi:hypothetical protein